MSKHNTRGTKGSKGKRAWPEFMTAQCMATWLRSRYGACVYIYESTSLESDTGTPLTAYRIAIYFIGAEDVECVETDFLINLDEALTSLMDELDADGGKQYPRLYAKEGEK